MTCQIGYLWPFAEMEGGCEIWKNGPIWLIWANRHTYNPPAWWVQFNNNMIYKKKVDVIDTLAGWNLNNIVPESDFKEIRFAGLKPQWRRENTCLSTKVH